MNANLKKRVLLIGAGPTSSLIAYTITTNRALKEAVDLHVWEKGNEIGGRFRTAQSTRNPECLADLGAQYLTYSKGGRYSQHYFDNLKQHNLIRELDTQNIPGFHPDPTKTHFACVNGTGSIVKHFFEQGSITNSKIRFNRPVKKVIVNIAPGPGNCNVEAVTEQNEKETFDLVISTMPAPELFQLEGFTDLLSSDPLKKQYLEAIKYSSRFALGLFFDDSTRFKSSSHPMNFVSDPIIRYWSIENVKRTGEFQGPTSVVMHTSVDFGAKNVEKDEELVKKEILQKAIEILPEAAGISNELVKSHKWRYSQVLEPYYEEPGCVRIARNFVAAGDGFSRSGLEGCTYSALQAILAIKMAFHLDF